MDHENTVKDGETRTTAVAVRVRKHPFSDGPSHRSFLHHYPHPRSISQRPYPHPTPSHPLLVEVLCPLRCTLTSAELETLRWESIKDLCCA